MPFEAARESRGRATACKLPALSPPMQFSRAMAARRGAPSTFRPGRLSDLALLRISDPKAWEKRIRAAMKECEGRVPDAAKALAVSPRQLWRVLNEPVFQDVERAGRGNPHEK